MRSLLLAYCTAAVAIAAPTFISPPPAQAMTMATPAGLSVAVRESTDKLDVQCGCGGYAYYAPYAYSYGYAPYAYSYYRPMLMAMPIDRTPTARTPMAGMAHVFGEDGVAGGDNEARFLLNPLQPA